MWRALRDLPAFIGHLEGPRLFAPFLLDKTWPVLWVLAAIYRRTFLRRSRVIVVIGSVGKTTTKRAIDAALGESVAIHAAGHNYGLSLALNVFRSRPSDTYAVFEVGIAGTGRMASYAWLLAPDIVVVTAIASDHNRSLPTLEHTRAEKVKMVRALKPGGLAILNGDDPHVLWMATQTAAQVITYGFGETTAVRASDEQLEWPAGMRFTLHTEGKEREIRTRLLGRHLIYPVLAAAAVSLAEGLPLETTAKRLERLDASRRRLQPIVLASGVTLLSDDFKASWESILAALDTLAAVKAGRRIVVLGDIHEPPGAQRLLYQTIGKRLAQIADFAVLVGSDNHRALIAAAVRSGMDRSRLVYVSSRWQEAVTYLRERLLPNDVVLIKGSESRRLQRITLGLQGITIRCPAKLCRVRIHNCTDCPLRDRGASDLKNFYLAPLVEV